MNLVFSRGIFMCFENIPCKVSYSMKKAIWNDPQTIWDSFQTST